MTHRTVSIHKREGHTRSCVSWPHRGQERGEILRTLIFPSDFHERSREDSAVRLLTCPVCSSSKEATRSASASHTRSRLALPLPLNSLSRTWVPSRHPLPEPLSLPTPPVSASLRSLIFCPLTSNCVDGRIKFIPGGSALRPGLEATSRPLPVRSLLLQRLPRRLPGQAWR